ncbi:MAG: hypothetical protein IKY52_12820 [Clostridia bacterium]|nr:hypothetical protein [Clostridia bacterium]
MFDILTEMFARPGNAFSALPFWFWNDRLDKEELVRQVDDFHKKGVNGFIIHPRMGMEVEGGYMGETYLDMVEACLEAAKKRRMLVMLYDEAMYPSGSAHGMVVASNPLFAARALYARPTGSYTLAEGEEAQLRMALQFGEDGKLTDVRTGEEGEEIPADYVWYDFILGFTGGTIRGIAPDEEDGQPNAPAAADLLNPEATAAFIASTHEVYYKRFAADFGSVITAIFTDEPSLTGRCANMGKTETDENGRITVTHRIPWTYDFHETFAACGGDAKMLAAQLFTPAEKRLARDGKYCYDAALRKGLLESYYKPLQDWCFRHGIALTGHPAASQDIGMEEAFDIPGQDLVWRMVEPGTELTSPDSPLAKCSADMARHKGIARNLCEALGVCGQKGNPWDLSPAEMMWYLNFLFARGVNMIAPHAFYYSLKTPLQSDERPPDVGPGNIFWDQYKPLAGYIKRMSWLNSTNSNNPHAAVLCDGDYMPVNPVKPLYEMGYTFNYLTMEQLENRVRVHDGKLYIDRYVYDTLLIDSRLRLTPSLVRKIGEFVTLGGRMHRGSDFRDFMKKNVKKTSYFDAQNPNIRFVHLTKSGYPFFLLFNEGDTWAKGHLVTDTSGTCRRFDPFTGKTEPVYAELCADGLRYPVEIAPWSVTVLGMNTDLLPELGENPAEVLSEITALSDTRQTFTYTPAENRRVRFCCNEVLDRADVTVNGKSAGVLLYKPYRLDITDLLTEGENTVTWTVTGSAANTYGKPVPTGVTGARAEIFEIR